MELIINSEDFSEEERNSLANFHKNGCPGLSRISDTDTFQWFELYMSGKTYREIADITKSKRDLILYISNKLKWNEKRMKYYSDISENFNDKLTKVKIDSLNTVANAIMALGKYHNDKFNSFLSTKDGSIIEGIDTKLLEKYYKSMELLGKLTAPAQSASDKHGTNINVNVGPNVEIRSNDGKNIEITDKNVGSVLRTLASIKEGKDEDEDDDE